MEDIVDTLKRQLSDMLYFEIEGVDTSEAAADDNKLQQAPLTNLGRESQFTSFDNMVKFSGRMTRISTHSKKNMWPRTECWLIPHFLTSHILRSVPDGTDTGLEGSTACEASGRLLAIVKATKHFSLKRELKQKKNFYRSVNLMADLLPHVLEMLQRLNKKQLLTVIRYLRITINPCRHSTETSVKTANTQNFIHRN